MAEMMEKKPDLINGDNNIRGKNKPETDVEVSYDSRVARNGMKLHPQPTADPRDPLNWPTAKKNTILGIVMFKLGDSIHQSSRREDDEL